MSDTANAEKEWETYLLQCIGAERAKRLHDALDVAGYFSEKFLASPNFKQDGFGKKGKSLDGPLLNVLVDYLHYAKRERQPIDSARLLEITTLASSLFEKYSRENEPATPVEQAAP